VAFLGLAQWRKGKADRGRHNDPNPCPWSKPV